MDLTQIIITSISAIAGGFVGFYAKIFHLNHQDKLDKENSKIEERKKLILELRTEISNTDWNNNKSFLNSTNYMRIRKFLSPKFIKDLEPGKIQTIRIMVGSPRSYYDNKFYEELDRIEKEWDCGID